MLTSPAKTVHRLRAMRKVLVVNSHYYMILASKNVFCSYLSYYFTLEGSIVVECTVRCSAPEVNSGKIQLFNYSVW